MSMYLKVTNNRQFIPRLKSWAFLANEVVIFLCLFSSAYAYSDSDFMPYIITYYTFDNVANFGYQFIDIANGVTWGNTINESGVIKNVNTLNSSCAFGNCTMFDTTGGVSSASSVFNNLARSQDFSVICWRDSAHTTTDNVIMGQDAPNDATENTDWFLQEGHSGEAELYWCGTYPTGAQSTIGGWNMWSVTWTEVSNNVTLYRNATQRASSTAPSCGANAQNGIQFGEDVRTANLGNFEIDSCMYINKSLSGKEIEYLWNITSTRNIGTEETPPVENFTITAKNARTSSALTGFNASINGIFYNSNPTGAIITSILTNATTTYRVEVNSSGYYNYLNASYNVSSNLNASLTPYSLEFVSQFPANNTQYSTTSIYANITLQYNGTSSQTYCNLMVNSNNEFSQSIAGNGTKQYGTGSPLTLTAGTKTYNWTCYNEFLTFTSNNTMFYIDATFPTITTTFENNSVYYNSNITANFNFTDDQSLYFWNISVNEKEIESQIIYGNTSNSSYYLNINTLEANIGKNSLTAVAKDGHTANVIGTYDVSTGIFGDVLQFTDKSKSVKIQATDKTFFDKWTATKQTDRYTFKYVPDKESSTKTFIVNCDDTITIMNNQNLPYKKWLICGNKWIDFKIPNENPDISIKQINSKQAEVTLKGIKNTKEIQFSSIGELNTYSVTYDLYVLNATATANAVTFEGTNNPFTLSLNMTDINTTTKNAYLVWDSIDFSSGILTNTTQNDVIYSRIFPSPHAVHSLVNWTWFFNVSNSEMFNISGNQTYYAMSITNCTAGTIYLNYTLYNETTKAKLTVGIKIETDLIITSYANTSLFWNFSTLRSSNDLTICFPDILNASNFMLGAITRYSGTGAVMEYHYIQGMNLSNADIPKIIKLYDLDTADSTSFLITYKDENFLAKPNRIIDILRYYVSDGVFTSVENGKTDDAGQTNAHLVTEDVIYMFNVYVNGTLEYSSTQYKALCQAVPCTISLRKQGNTTFSSINNYNLNLAYSKTTKTATLIFSTKDGTSAVMNLSIYKNNGYDNETMCSMQQVTSGGTLTCTIPTSIQTNQSYIIKVKEGYNSTTLAYRIVADIMSAYDRYGGTGIVMSAFAYLTLVLMGLSSGIIAVASGILGLILITLLGIFDGGSLIGLGSALIWVICAGGILIWKMYKRRVQ